MPHDLVRQHKCALNMQGCRKKYCLGVV